MVAKINRGASLRGAVEYNQKKVEEGKARIISGNRMIAEITDDPDRIKQQTLLAFENYLLANRNTEKPILHISLNPAPEDNLTDEQFANLAQEYMQKMGYGDQPYIVYMHEDIGRRHIHILTTCVKEDGRKISDAYEWRRSMQTCRELETKYGLRNIADKRKEMTEAYLMKADYSKGDIKQQIANILRSTASYRFQSFGEYSAMLACYNIEAKQVRGEYNGTPYNGIVYLVTDDNGKALSPPIKASLFDKKFGYEGVNKRIKWNTIDYKNKKWQPKIRNEVALALNGCEGDRQRFVELLRQKGIGVVFRENDKGRIYGATFIDHNAQEVYNGSRLGKEFSANALNKLFNTQETAPLYTPELQTFSHADKETSLEQVFGIFNFEQHGTDYQEEAFERRMKKKKKKKGKDQSRGI